MIIKHCSKTPTLHYGTVHVHVHVKVNLILPMEGVCSPRARAPAGVALEKLGVAPASDGVLIWGVEAPPTRWLAGVSSQRDLRLLPGVSVTPMRGVSPHPPLPGVSPLSARGVSPQRGVSSQRFLLPGVAIQIMKIDIIIII